MGAPKNLRKTTQPQKTKSQRGDSQPPSTVPRCDEPQKYYLHGSESQNRACLCPHSTSTRERRPTARGRSGRPASRNQLVSLKLNREGPVHPHNSASGLWGGESTAGGSTVTPRGGGQLSSVDTSDYLDNRHDVRPIACTRPAGPVPGGTADHVWSHYLRGAAVELCDSWPEVCCRCAVGEPAERGRESGCDARRVQGPGRQHRLRSGG
jgi:hypothetical protein